MATSSIAPGADPSMEDILASIRRILDEEPAPAAPATIAAVPDSATPHAPPARAAAEAPHPASGHHAWDQPGELLLDASMMLPDAPAGTDPPHPEGRFPPGSDARYPSDPPAPAALFPAPAPALASALPENHPMPSPDADLPPAEPAPLLAPATADIAASSMMSLVRAVATERGSAIYRNGPTIEDVVREEIRPLVKDWLDSNLPPLVERLVRAEIERVVSRVAP